MEKLKTDVAVLGTGAAGFSAALTAVEGGARVILFEKRSVIGGISINPLGTFAVESKLQRQYNIPITRDEIFKLIMERTHWRADARLWKAFIDKTASTIEWLEQEGVEFEFWPFYQFQEAQLTGHVVKAPPGRFSGLLKVLREKAEGLGAEIRLATPGKKLVKDGGAITGLIAEDESGQEISVDAKAVIIASGGFADNKEMVKEHLGFEPGVDYSAFPRPDSWMNGDGIRMAWEAGAASDGMSLQLIYGTATRMVRFDKGEQKGASGGLSAINNERYIFPWINQDGVRFLDEGICQDVAYPANAIARQKGRCAYMIFDSNIKKYLEEETFDNVLLIFPPTTKPEVVDIDALFRICREQGDKSMIAADSLAGLARGIGVNPDVMEKTIDEYNGFCAKGVDELFCKNPHYLRPVKNPRFYAVKLGNSATGTLGGIKINDRAEVINTQGDIIPGLYAAGDCANGATSYDFWIAHGLPGNPSSFALNTGRIAAENALKYMGK